VFPRALLYLASAAALALALRSSGVSFARATARAFAKFAALVNRRRSPDNELSSASSPAKRAAAALGPKPHHFPASSSEFSSENVVNRPPRSYDGHAITGPAVVPCHCSGMVQIAAPWR
jgi:hypothetical protein